MHAELDGSEVRALMKIGEEEVYLPAASVDGAIKQCRASSGQRTAAVVKWLHKSFGALVMVRAVADLVWPSGRQTLDLPLVDHLRDAVLGAFPCAFNVPFEDDYEWPESGQTQADVSKHEMVTRVVWVELILRPWARRLPWPGTAYKTLASEAA